MHPLSALLRGLGPFKPPVRCCLPCPAFPVHPHLRVPAWTGPLQNPLLGAPLPLCTPTPPAARSGPSLTPLQVQPTATPSLCTPTPVNLRGLGLHPFPFAGCYTASASRTCLPSHCILTAFTPRRGSESPGRPAAFHPSTPPLRFPYSLPPLGLNPLRPLANTSTTPCVPRLTAAAMSTKRQAPPLDPGHETEPEEPVTTSFLRNLIGGLSSDLGSQIRDMQGLVVAQGQILTAHAAKLDDHTKQLQSCCQQVDELRDRLALQESKPSTDGSTAPPSTAPSDMAPDKRPLLVIGGWEQDTKAEAVLLAAKKALSDTGIADQFDLNRLFVPGPRRGFALLPLAEKGTLLTQAQVLATNSLLQQFRSHQPTTEAGRNVFLAWSVPPEMRKKATFAGKVKRCVLSVAAAPPTIEIEWRAGSVWVQGVRVASATTAPPAGSDVDVLPSKAWLDLGRLSQILRVELADIKTQWTSLSGHLH